MKNSTFNTSFKNALKGVKYAAENERNFRVHIVFTIYTLILSFFYNFTSFEYFMLLIAITSVLVLELVNTAIEKTVDLCTLEYHPLAAASKDVMSGAVLISSCAAIIVGVFLFFRIEKIVKIWALLIANPLLFLAIAIILVLSYIFVIHWSK